LTFILTVLLVGVATSGTVHIYIRLLSHSISYNVIMGRGSNHVVGELNFVRKVCHSTIN